MTWITTIEYEDATGRVKQLYDRIKGPDNNVDNIMMAHSLRPHTMEGHMALYKSVIHHPRNTLPKWLLEAVGVYVSLLNDCEYCIEHHYAGMKRLLDNDERSSEIRRSLEADAPALAFAGRELAALEYSAKLTRSPSEISPQELGALRNAGLEDGEILEVNQVAAYFGYANRTVLGLGIDAEGDMLGLSPSDGEGLDNWSHR